MRAPLPKLFAMVLAAALALGGCGKAGLSDTARQARGGPIAPVSAHGAAGLSTKNTTRLGGAGPVLDAAAVARAIYPGLTAATRPAAVAIVDEHDWPAALAASALASAPLHAPLIYSVANELPPASLQALRAMHPIGAPALGGAQAIEIGGTFAAPPGYRARVLTEREPIALAATVEQLLSSAEGSPPHQVIIAAADGPPALAMPAAGLAAETGAPILFVTAAGVPPATSAVLTHLKRPAIYAIGPSSAVSAKVLAALAHFGAVTRIGDLTPSTNAIAVARFTDGTFGWGVQEPGHGLVFANSARPLDAPAAASLAANGDYGPLLLLEGPSQVSPALSTYLSDIRPGYSKAPQFRPVHGVYNHGWLIGDEQTVSAITQAELDAMLEIAPENEHPQ
jgi:hypothetical protein